MAGRSPVSWESWSGMDIMMGWSSCRLLRAAAPISLPAVVLARLE